MQHRKKVSAMALFPDSSLLVSGDHSGAIYFWDTSRDLNLGFDDEINGETTTNFVKTFEYHKDKGPITNLVPFFRPLSLYGLKANMKAYEPGEVKAF